MKSYSERQGTVTIMIWDVVSVLVTKLPFLTQWSAESICWRMFQGCSVHMPINQLYMELCSSQPEVSSGSWPVWRSVCQRQYPITDSRKRESQTVGFSMTCPTWSGPHSLAGIYTTTATSTTGTLCSGRRIAQQ